MTTWQRFKLWLTSERCADSECRGRVPFVGGLMGTRLFSVRRALIYCEGCMARFCDAGKDGE